MTEVLDALELELVRAVRRRNARVRRRRTLAAFVGAGAGLAVAAGGGYAAVEHVSIGPLFGSASEAVSPAGEQRSVVTVDGGDGVGWKITSYRTRAELVATTVTRRPDDGTRPSVAARNGFAIALGLRSGPLGFVGSDVVDADGRQHVLIAGTVADDVTRLTVEVGGERATATLSPVAVHVPVEIGPDSTLTAEGKRELAEMPDDVGVRSFGATFAPGALTGMGLAKATVQARRADGTVERQQTPLCVSDRCEAPDANRSEGAGQGRAG